MKKAINLIRGDNVKHEKEKKRINCQGHVVWVTLYIVHHNELASAKNLGRKYKFHHKDNELLYFQPINFWPLFKSRKKQKSNEEQ